MKKILCLLLTLVLVFACVSCNKNSGDDANNDTNNGNQSTDNGSNDTNNGGDDTDADANVDYVAKIFDTITASAPTQIVTKIDYIVGSKIYTSSYTTEKDSKTGVQRFEFHIKRYATVEELLPNNEKKIDGVVWKNADGSVIGSEGDTWSSAEAVGYLSEMLSLKKEYFKSVEFSDNNNDLVATVAAEYSERVFGAEIASSGDITVEVDTNGTYLYEVTVKYTTKSGATMRIVTSYDYAIINITDNK